MKFCSVRRKIVKRVLRVRVEIGLGVARLEIQLFVCSRDCSAAEG